jgi:hypothetical protein
MFRRIALLGTDVSEEPSATIIRVTKIAELVTTLTVTSNQSTFRRNTNGGSRFLRNVGSYKCHTAQHIRRRHSS